MEKVILEKDNILEYVETTINDVISTPIEVIDDKFHHNTRYEDTISIIENGILTGKDQNKIGILSDEKLELFADIESHPNGSDSISLAVVGLTDLNPNEFEYNPFCEKSVDILITSDVAARRVSTNYGNEYLADESIKPDKFRSIDARILAYIAAIRMSTIKEPVDVSITQVLKNYNNLRKLACALREKSIDIPLREMSSNEGTSIDIDRLSSMPKVKIKRLN